MLHCLDKPSLELLGDPGNCEWGCVRMPSSPPRVFDSRGRCLDLHVHPSCLAIVRLVHRWIGPIAALFLTLIAATGMYMQVEALWSAYHRASQAALSVLPDEKITPWIEIAIVAAHRAQPQAAISALELSMGRDQPRVDVIWGSPNTLP